MAEMSRQMDTKLEMEQQLERRLEKFLEKIVGPNNVVARVNMDVDFKNIQIRQQKLEPVMVNNQPLVNEQVIREASSSEGIQPTGEMPPGQTANIPEPPSGTVVPPVSSEKTNTDKQRTLRTYNFTKVEEITEYPVGSVLNRNIAIIINRALSIGVFYE